MLHFQGRATQCLVSPGEEEPGHESGAWRGALCPRTGLKNRREINFHSPHSLLTPSSPPSETPGALLSPAPSAGRHFCGRAVCATEKHQVACMTGADDSPLPPAPAAPSPEGQVCGCVSSLNTSHPPAFPLQRARGTKGTPGLISHAPWMSPKVP